MIDRVKEKIAKGEKLTAAERALVDRDCLLFTEEEQKKVKIRYTTSVAKIKEKIKNKEPLLKMEERALKRGTAKQFFTEEERKYSYVEKGNMTEKVKNKIAKSEKLLDHEKNFMRRNQNLFTYDELLYARIWAAVSQERIKAIKEKIARGEKVTRTEKLFVYKYFKSFTENEFDFVRGYSI